jgi:hypothetical protein
MKTNGRREVIAGIARQSLVLAALLAMVVSAASIGRAQSSATPAAALAAKPTVATAPAKAPAAPVAKPVAGQHEGIAVHGHWVIEVKNPDGKVTARREFENAIQPAGMSYLASLLAGNNAPGGLSIVLNGGTASWASPPDALNTGFGSEPGPCLPVLALYAPSDGGLAGGLYTGTACLITAGANTSGYGSVLGSICVTSQQTTPANQPLPCSTNLMASAPTLTSANNGAGLSAQISLTGSVGVSSVNPGNVTDVEAVFGACDGNSTPVNCLIVSQAGINNVGNYAPGTKPVAVNVFTMKTLDGIGTDPQQVPYSPGQTIAVTVTISFQ